jgi:hypothetical protein
MAEGDAAKDTIRINTLQAAAVCRPALITSRIARVLTETLWTYCLYARQETLDLTFAELIFP